MAQFCEAMPGDYMQQTEYFGSQNY